MINAKYAKWDGKRFKFQNSTFYYDRFNDSPATVVKIGSVLVYYQVDGDNTVYSMPLINLDPKQNVILPVEDL